MNCVSQQGSERQLERGVVCVCETHPTELKSAGTHNNIYVWPSSLQTASLQEEKHAKWGPESLLLILLS
jgi:hypothetical protein